MEEMCIVNLQQIKNILLDKQTVSTHTLRLCSAQFQKFCMRAQITIHWIFAPNARKHKEILEQVSLLFKESLRRRRAASGIVE